MSKTKTGSFVNQVIAILQGDDATAKAEKHWRQADSALKSYIASQEGKTIDFEDAVSDAQEMLDSARINSGNPITTSDKSEYIKNLLNRINKLEQAKEDLENHKKDIETIKREHKALSSGEAL